MGLFTRRLQAAPFGVLATEGQSKVWEGEIGIPHLGEGFALRVHGARQGPTAAQAEAFARLLANARQVRQEATPALLAFLTECGVVPPGVALNAATLWDHLTPCFIEVHPEDGEGTCSLGYEIPWEASQLVHIDTAHGAFTGVHAE
ncbi:hypothetical protein HNP48_005754 [Acidovorax soli]|uniref:Uncharacterized protein n=1 Tax=Acidovorax soli TaxID=592050 RepID=A0A7X0PJD2_9BURK|nr:hypothetical protein [Acidovorax soli]MBB6563037.1 hypothetical protein [Acidovorax soli]